MGEILAALDALYIGVVDGNLWIFVGGVVATCVALIRKVLKPRGYLQGDRWGAILPAFLAFAGSLANAAIAEGALPDADALIAAFRVLAVAVVVYVIPRKLLFPSDRKDVKCLKCGRRHSPSLRRKFARS